MFSNDGVTVVKQHRGQRDRKKKKRRKKAEEKSRSPSSISIGCSGFAGNVAV